MLSAEKTRLVHLTDGEQDDVEGRQSPGLEIVEEVFHSTDSMTAEKSERDLRRQNDESDDDPDDDLAGCGGTTISQWGHKCSGPKLTRAKRVKEFNFVSTIH